MRQSGVLFTGNAAVDGQHDQFFGSETGFDQASVFPGTVLIEDSLAFLELVGGLFTGAGGQGLGVSSGIGDVQIPNVAEVIQVGALDGSGLLGDAILSKLVV